MPIIVTMTDMNTKIADTKTARAIDIRCKNCFARYYNRLFDKYQVGEDQRIYFHLLFNEVMFKYKSLSRPEIQQRLDERACELIGLDDPFETEKAQSNSEAMGLYVRWKNKVLESRKDSQGSSVILFSVMRQVLSLIFKNFISVYDTNS